MEGAIAIQIRSAIVAILIAAVCGGGGAASTTFIRASCRSTLYPSLCIQSLTPYAPAVHHSPRHLAHAALAVSAARAQAASTFISRMSAAPTVARSSEDVGGGAVRDCLETIRDSVDRLRVSAREMKRMGRAGSRRYERHLGNMMTWASAALTDEVTCLDSLSEDGGAAAGVRAAVRERVVELAHVTSNALAFVNGLKRN